MNTDVQRLIDDLGLVAHPMGGYFRQIYKAHAEGVQARPLLTVIHLLLSEDTRLVALHRMSADAVHFFHHGSPLTVVTVDADGRLRRTTMGAELDGGERLQVVVPGGTWKAFELESGPYALISEAVAPGWIATDDETATPQVIEQEVPHLAGELERFVPGGARL